ncbi:hypothetical protein [Candidatus Cyrtobacter comes]|nr:hypothetical protein [Candidatus Cyrtobacter comes]
MFPFYHYDNPNESMKWLMTGFKGLGICNEVTLGGELVDTNIMDAYKMYLFAFLGYDELINIRKTFPPYSKDKIHNDPIDEFLKLEDERLNILEDELGEGGLGRPSNIFYLVTGVSAIHTTTDWLKVYKDYKDHENVSKFHLRSHLLNAGVSSTHTVLLITGHSLPQLPAIKTIVQVYNKDYAGAITTSLFTVGFYVVNFMLSKHASPEAAANTSKMFVAASGIHGIYELGNLVYNLFIVGNPNEVMNDKTYACPDYIPNGTMGFKPVCWTFIGNLNETKTSLIFQLEPFEVFNETVEM